MITTLQNEIKELQEVIPKLQERKIRLSKPEHYPELLLLNNMINGYNQAIKTYTRAIERNYQCQK